MYGMINFAYDHGKMISLFHDTKGSGILKDHKALLLIICHSWFHY